MPMVALANLTMTYNVSKNLTANAFTRTGYTFVGWNTKADGTGTNYTNGASVKNLTESGSITLYAKWTPNTYNIIFNTNGGAGTMANLAMTYDVSKNLPSNTYTRTDYAFNGWNIKADGTGTNYANGASVKNLAASGNIVLYATWKRTNSGLEVTGNLIKNEQYKIIKTPFYTPISTFQSSISAPLTMTLTDKSKTTITNRTEIITGDILNVGSDFSYTILAIGDVNSDGVINHRDANELSKYIINHTSNIKYEYLLAGDMDNNYNIKINDVMKLVRITS